MKKILIFLVISLATVSTVSVAQVCGTTVQDLPVFDQQAYQRFQNKQTTSRNKTKQRIGITIHVVMRFKGNFNIDPFDLYKELETVNRSFSDANIEFFFCGSPRKIIGQHTYTYSQAADSLNTPNHMPHTINVFYVDGLLSEQGGSLCGQSHFPWYNQAADRFIMMNKSCRIDGTTLSHELGHFLGLLHTHETVLGRELVNGSNCEEAGDLICDTPADPNLLAIDGLVNCVYKGNRKDANGDLYQPNSNNIMSYAPSECLSSFTKEQGEKMNYYFETTDLVDLIQTCDFYPDFSITRNKEEELYTTTIQPLTITYEFNGLGIQQDQELEIAFLLKPIESSTAFPIHKEKVVMGVADTSFDATFKLQLPSDKVSGSYKLIAVLDPNSVILESEKNNNIQETIVRIDNAALPKSRLFPNPATDQVSLLLKDQSNTGELTIRISDLLGRIYTSKKQYKRGEELFLQSDVSFLPQGVYFLSVENDKNQTIDSFLFYKK